MINSRLMHILRKQILTEKTSPEGDEVRLLAFEVLRDATKGEIKQAAELLFGVKVKSVRTLNYQGKKRRSAHGIGARSDWKKAYLILEPGQQIDVNNQSVAKESI
ncbi:MAG: 50S ribosomal protein L23 [Candidatus Anaerobiospirillum pullicola]|uniref:Large ribosomal subunit protein uL23 n=1 Tax=Candidatus Anaerobiospirillum pullicola TaxID=2838451 RepID=A0A948WYW8_9GAMM|nr:50S ribosomal protein L23 [Candidatus Anaerobiospirillum pullicola]